MKLLWVHKDLWEALKANPMIYYDEGVNEMFYGTLEEIKTKLWTIKENPEKLKEWIPFFTMSD